MNEILLILAAFLKEEMQKELILQKHQATGKLLSSIDVILIEEAAKIILRGQSDYYGQFVERGRRPGVKRVPADALESWARTIGMTLRQGQTYRNLAFAIQQTIYREGIPTRRSQTLAERRTGWVTHMLDASEQKIASEIERWAGEKIDITIQNYIKKVGITEIRVL